MYSYNKTKRVTYHGMQKEVADKYQGLFNFFSQEHGIILTQGEMNDIIYAVKKHNNAIKNNSNN